jgi:hypothetical protein
MVRLKVDIIIVTTTPAALAVKNATTTIPVVFPNAISPVESGVVASLAHPGGNVTGGAAQTAALSTKRLEILKEAVPGLSRVAVLWNVANPALARWSGFAAPCRISRCWPDAALEAPAIVAGLDDVAVVGEPVEERIGHLGVAEDGRPFAWRYS